MRFIGVDPSVTGFASVILDDQLNVIKEITLKENTKLSDPQRMMDLVDRFIKESELVKGDTLFIEGFAYHGKIGYGTSKAYGIGWLLRERLVRHGCFYLDISPSRLKKYATDNGRASKEEVISSVELIFGYNVPNRTTRANSPKNDDLADAYTLSRMSRDYYYKFYKEGTEDYFDYQDKILDAVHKQLQEGQINSTN